MTTPTWNDSADRESAFIRKQIAPMKIINMVKPYKSTQELLGTSLAELEEMHCRLSEIGEHLDKTVDACVNGKIDLNVSAAVCLVHFSLEVRELANNLSILLRTTRERSIKADKLTERLKQLRK